MIQEYLFVSNEFKENLKELALPDNVDREIEIIENSSCWMFRLSTPGNDEKAAACLSALVSDFCEKYHATVLTDECSAYFNKRLYPIVNEFERKLRKLLYIASAVQEDDKAREAINNLESQNLDTIFKILFFDSSFIKKAKEKVSKKDLYVRRADLLKEISEIDESVLWDTLLGENCAPALYRNHRELREYRNDVMHAHNFGYAEYRKARHLFEKVNIELDAAIAKVIGAKEDKEYLTSVNYNMILTKALENIAEVVRDMDISPYAEALKVVANTIASYNINKG